MLNLRTLVIGRQIPVKHLYSVTEVRTCMYVIDYVIIVNITLQFRDQNVSWVIVKKVC